MKTDPQRSDAENVPVLAGSMEASQEMVTFPGQEIVGGVLSFMVMNCVPVEMLKQASLADHVLTIVPVPLHPVNPNTLSEKVITSALTGVQLSNASACPVNDVEVLCSQLIVSDGGKFRTGAVLSIITIV